MCCRARWASGLTFSGRIDPCGRLIEATIDFADEDVPVDVTPEVAALLERLLSELRQELDGAVAAERVRDGFEVAIVGAECGEIDAVECLRW